MTSLSLKNISFNRTDILILAALLLATACIYYPIYYADYLYTDEAPQIWFAGKGINLTSIPQGRWLTYRLFTWVFSYIHTTHAVAFARMFSLGGWMLCMPVWYFMLKDVVLKNKLPALLAPVAMVYLICMPPFAIFIGWAACLEMFIACTAGLISGYLLYNNIYNGKRIPVIIIAVTISTLAGLVSLFTYQHGFGCFFIPFFIQFIAIKRSSKKIIAGIGAALLIYILYWLVFTSTLHVQGMEASSRSAFAANPVKKLLFLFGRPLEISFHFTWLFNEKSIAGAFVYFAGLVCWGVQGFRQLPSMQLHKKVFYYGGLIVFFVLAYLPSMLVAENYASHRTLFALNMMVFLLVATTLFSSLKKYDHQKIFAAVISIFFLLTGWYNFNRQFIHPLTKEYSTIKKMVAHSYTNKIHTIWFIRPREDAFEKKYGLVTSWDEFGVPSGAKPWVAEPLFKQLVFEQTGSRQTAESLVVKSWESYDAFAQSGETLTAGILFIDGAVLIQHQ